MCGIVGVVGRINYSVEKMFKDMLCIDTIRGHHSTGVLSRKRNNKETMVNKTLGTPWDLFATKKHTTQFTPVLDLLIGHNRAATKGKVSRNNAHPFEFDNVTGVHNGTLVNQTLLPDHEEFDVDSENIYHSIQTLGVSETTKKLHGAFALVWYDDRTNSVHFLKNSQRPMCYAYSSDMTTLFFASEADIIRMAARRQDVSLAKFKEGEVFTFGNEEEYIFKIPDKIDDKFSDELEVVDTHDFFIPPTTTAYGTGGANTTVRGRGYQHTSNNIISMGYVSRPITGFLQERLTVAEFIDRTFGVCHHCNDTVRGLQAGLTWLSKTAVVCSDCTDAITYPLNETKFFDTVCH